MKKKDSSVTSYILLIGGSYHVMITAPKLKIKNKINRMGIEFVQFEGQHCTSWINLKQIAIISESLPFKEE